MRRILAAASLVLFLAITVFYGRPVDGVWNSPDETANAFWSERVATGEPLAIVDAIVGLGQGSIHPRSMAVAGDALVPGSFPGIFLLYGALKLVFKLPFFLYTPILTAIAGACFGALVAKLFDRKTGILAAALFFLHPAVLYYGARGLFHNLLFVDVVIVAAAFFVLRPLSSLFGARASADDALGGFILAWALVIRTSEAIWVLPAFAVFLTFAGKDRWKRLAAAVGGGLVPLFILLKINATLYGSPWRTAYVPPERPAETEISTPDSDAVTVTAPEALLPFGLHPRLAARNVWNYGLKIFWWQSVLAAVGFALWLYGIRKASGPQKLFALAAVLTAAWLATLYGSWLIRDRFDHETVTIGTSYVRYFLPAYVAAMPFAAFALVRLSGLVRRPAVIPVIVAVIAVFGLRSSVFAGDESLRSVRATLEGNAAKKTELLSLIEPGAVVMTERFDKLLVPERLRIISAMDDAAFAAAYAATEFVPVYWYGLRPTDEEASRLFGLSSSYGLLWYEEAEPAPGEVLYYLDPYFDFELEHEHFEEEYVE